MVLLLAGGLCLGWMAVGSDGWMGWRVWLVDRAYTLLVVVMLGARAALMTCGGCAHGLGTDCGESWRWLAV
jgi:hypothetical protein